VSPAGRGAGRAGEPHDVRLDLFLRNTGLLKRRPVAHDACDSGRVLLDGKPARSSARVHAGQLIRLDLAWRLFEAEILWVPAHPVARDERERCFRVIRDERRDAGYDEDGMIA